MSITRLVAFPWHRGLRCDQFLAAASELSRRRVRRLLDEGRVTARGRVVRVQSRTVETGDVFDLLLAPSEVGAAARPELPAVAVVHEDRFLLAVNKPAGVLSQPSEESRRIAGEERRLEDLALDERVLLWMAVREGGRPFLRLLHRLDRPTSGVALFGRTPEAVAALSQAWKQGEVERRYLAVVEGVPDFPQTEVEAPLARDPSGAWRFVVQEGGKEARTRVRVEARGADTAVVECRLFTGRTHQVRVHLAHLGYPVLGDRLYGAREGLAPRPLLHARALRLSHPGRGASGRLHLEAPVPEDMVPFLAPNPAPAACPVSSGEEADG